MRHYQLYQDTNNRWRWRYLSSSGRIIATSSEDYWNRNDALTGIALMKGSYVDPVKE